MYILCAAMMPALLCGCELRPVEKPEPTQTPEAIEEPVQEPVTEAYEDPRIAEMRDETVIEAQRLAQQYYYDEAIGALESFKRECNLETDEVDSLISDIENQKAALVKFEGDVPHIFFHSLIVYPEMIFTDLDTPMGGYNSGFSEKQEMEKMLPQLYERGYVLYDLDKLWVKENGVMVKQDIYLPEGKTPLILSVDDVAYAYGDGYAQKLIVDENGELMYLVNNPQGGVDRMPDGDVMGVLDKFVEEHPDFAYQGHKGTIALTGFQGAFGYDYDIPAQADEMRVVVAALKADGWNFASHSYTHNRVKNFYGPGCSTEKIYYDINKWVDHCVPCLGETRLFIAPFGYRVQQPMLQCILDCGFEIYCTVDSKVYNELNPDYALMSRIEMGGYSMTYYTDLLNELFFDVDSVFDDAGRPPVIG